MEPTVRASLTYTDKHRELLQITGGWVDHPAELVEFKIHQSHSLLVGFLREAQFVAVEYATAAEGGDQQDHLQRQHSLHGFRNGTVCVKLTDVQTGRLLYGGNFEIGVNPLRISQIMSGLT